MAHILTTLSAGAVLGLGLVATAPSAGATPSADAVNAIEAHHDELGQSDLEHWSVTSSTYPAAPSATTRAGRSSSRRLPAPGRSTDPFCSATRPSAAPPAHSGFR